MKMVYNTKVYVDDAITNANLAASLIDQTDYDDTGNVTNFDYEFLYKKFYSTLAHDLESEKIGGDTGVVLGPKSNSRFASTINVLKFWVYNKKADGTVTLAKVVDSPDSNRGTVGIYYGGSLEKIIDESKAIAPDGSYLEDTYSTMMIYSEISFELNGIFGNSKMYGTTEYPFYVTKEHTTDVVKNHKYEEIDRLDPTCTEDGYILYECTDIDCPEGYLHLYELVLEKLGHDYSLEYEYADTSEPKGLRYRVCSKCGYRAFGQYLVSITGDENVKSYSGNGYYSPGSEVTVSCQLLYGYKLDKWVSSSVPMSTNRTYKFIMPYNSVEFTILTTEN